MEYLNLYLLLKTVKKQNSLTGLIRSGLSYKDIGEITELAAKENLLAITDNGIVLTLAGESKYDELKVLNKKTNKEEWIEKEVSSQISKLEPDFIFLPHPDELSF